jgi:chromosome segregation ATPase
MIGLEGKKISEASKRILETLNVIQQDARKFGQSLSVLNRHITNAKNAMEGVDSEYSRLSSKIDGVKSLKPEETKKIKEPEEEKELAPH